MKKLTLILLLTISFIGVKAQTSQFFGQDSLRLGPPVGTKSVAIYGKVWMKNLTSGLSSDSILVIRGTRVFKVAKSTFSPDSTVFQTVSNFFPKGDTRYSKLSQSTWFRSGGVLSPVNQGDRIYVPIVDTLTANDAGNYSHFYELGAIKMSATDKYFGRISDYAGYSNTVPVTGGNIWGSITYAQVAGINTQNWSENPADPLHPTLLGQASVIVSNIGATGTIESAHNFTAYANWKSANTLQKRMGFVVSEIRNTGGGTIDEQYGLYGANLTAATTNYFLYSLGGRNRLFGSMELPNLAAGTGGTDSTVVHDNTTDELRRVGNTGTGNAVYSNSPTLVTPNLGTPGTLVGTNITGTATALNIGGNANTATTLATGRTIAITGDLSYTSPSFDGSTNVTASGTLASIISAGGPTGSATVTPIITYDAKGRLTAVSSATITPAIGSVTGLGTGVGTALGTNVGSAGAFITYNGNAGTPSALVGTNISGTAAGLTAGTVTTNANLTGPITSVGNATSIASQTGTGSTFVVQNSPTLTTPVLGVATGTSLVTSGKIATTAGAVWFGSDGSSGFQGKINYDSGTGLQLQGKTGSSYDVSVFTPGGDELLTNTTGTKNVKIWGGFTRAYTAKTSNYTITNNDYYIDCTTGSFTITLPTAVGITGQTFVVVNSGTGVITMASTSSQTINGSAAGTVQIDNAGSRSFTSNGANWIISGGY